MEDCRNYVEEIFGQMHTKRQHSLADAALGILASGSFDGQSTLSLHLLAHHGRATPLLWQTVEKSRLKNNRARYEDQMLSKLKDSLPEDVNVTLIADRGFADKKFFEFLEETLNFNYALIRTLHRNQMNKNLHVIGCAKMAERID